MYVYVVLCLRVHLHTLNIHICTQTYLRFAQLKFENVFSADYLPPHDEGRFHCRKKVSRRQKDWMRKKYGKP